VRLHAYCILPAERPPAADLRGIDGARVEAVVAAGVLCWVSSLEVAPSATPDALRAHNAVVTAAMDRTVTPVPLRFGQLFTSRETLAEAMAERSAEWHRRLEQFAGHAEYGVRVTDAAGPQARDVRAAPRGSGTAYMQALARQRADEVHRHEEGARVAARVLEETGALVAAARAEPLAGPPALVSLAHLVAWKDVDDYHAVLRRMQARMTPVRLLFTGPWPPYSFVE
jgi:hypothetical protein